MLTWRGFDIGIIQHRLARRIIDPALAGRPRFVALLYFTSWAHLSLGAHVDLSSPNVELHMPGMFLRVGWLRPLVMDGFKFPPVFGIEQREQGVESAR